MAKFGQNAQKNTTDVFRVNYRSYQSLRVVFLPKIEKFDKIFNFLKFCSNRVYIDIFGQNLQKCCFKLSPKCAKKRPNLARFRTGFRGGTPWASSLINLMFYPPQRGGPFGSQPTWVFHRYTYTE